MAYIQIDATKQRFIVSNENDRLTIISEPINTPGMYEKYEHLEITLNREITEEKAWEIAYLLNNYSETIKINDPWNNNFVSE